MGRWGWGDRLTNLEGKSLAKVLATGFAFTKDGSVSIVFYDMRRQSEYFLMRIGSGLICTYDTLSWTELNWNTLSSPKHMYLAVDHLLPWTPHFCQSLAQSTAYIYISFNIENYKTFFSNAIELKFRMSTSKSSAAQSHNPRGQTNCLSELTVIWNSHPQFMIYNLPTEEI